MRMGMRMRMRSHGTNVLTFRATLRVSHGIDRDKPGSAHLGLGGSAQMSMGKVLRHRIPALPFEFWRNPRRTLRRYAMVRRGWPKIADVEEMSQGEFDDYVRYIGFESRIQAAVANSDARAAAEADSRVPVG